VTYITNTINRPSGHQAVARSPRAMNLARLRLVGDGGALEPDGDLRSAIDSAPASRLRPRRTRTCDLEIPSACIGAGAASSRTLPLSSLNGSDGHAVVAPLPGIAGG